MAVLDAYPGLTTEITVNKKPLAEYDGEEETSSTEVTRYIEARSGADFVIKTLFKAPFSTEQGVETSCIVDGNRGPRCGIAHNELLHRSANRMTGVTFSQDGRRFHQNYQFAKLNIVEEPEGIIDLKSLRKEVQSKGCIEVSYRWITNFRPSKQRSNTENPSTRPHEDLQVPVPRRTLPTIDAIPEKALKGDVRSYQAILGEPRVVKMPTGPGTTYDYVDRHPFGMIHFQYRSLAALKALRIIVDDEPVPSPKHERPTDGTSAKRSPVTSSRHEYKQVHRMKQEAEGIQSVKRERDAEHDVHGDSDDLSVVETRSCKRPRDDHEVIVLD